MTDPSQNGEATEILKLLGNTGTVLGIGENDGITFSNSYFLIQSGWSGYLLEPGRTFYALAELYQDNTAVHCYNYGINSTGEDQYFYESGAHVIGGTDLGLVSTTIEAERDKWSAHVPFEQVQAKFKTFAEFYEEAGSPTFDFISIDCEGMDWEVLKQIDLDKVGCRALCIEWNGKEDLQGLYHSYVTDFGMREYLRNGENIIYIQ